MSLEALIGDPTPLGARAWLVVLARARALRRLCESPALRPILDDAERSLVEARLAGLEDDLLARALREPADGPAQEPRAAAALEALEALDPRADVVTLLEACVPLARFKLAPDGRVRRMKPGSTTTAGMRVAALVVSTSGPLPGPAAPAPASPDPIVLTPAPAGPEATTVTTLPAEPAPSATPEPERALERLVGVRRRAAGDVRPAKVVKTARQVAARQVAEPAEVAARPLPVPAPPPRRRRRRDAEDDDAPKVSPFLKQKNILVGLALGALIVLAGSVKLSVEIWRLDDALYKYALFVAASLGLYGLGEVSTRKLGLPLTGRAFLGTFALLVPLDLLAADALDVPWPGAVLLALALLAASWRAVEPLVGRGRDWLAPAYAVLAGLELVVGGLAGPTSAAQDVAPLPRSAALVVAVIGAAVAVAGVTAYGRARATPEKRDRDAEPILAGLLLLLPGLLLLARVAVAARPTLGGLVGPVLLGLAAVPFEVARLLRADRSALAAADGGEVDPPSLGETLAQVGAGLLAAAGLLASVFEPVAALASGVVGVVVLGRVLRHDPKNDAPLAGLVAAGTFAWVALVGVVAGEGEGLRRWLPSAGRDAAVFYAPIAAALLLAAHAASRGAGRRGSDALARAAWLRVLGQGAVVALALALVGARETGAAGLCGVGLGLVLLSALDRRIEHAGVGLVLLSLASVAPTHGLLERSGERAPLLAAAGLVSASVGHLAASLSGARLRSLGAVLGRAALAVGPGLAVAALLGALASGSSAATVAWTSSFTSLALGVAAHARRRDGSAWACALLPAALAPAVAAVTVLGQGAATPFSEVLGGDAAARTALALGLEGALVAVLAALGSLRRLARRSVDVDEAATSMLAVGAMVVSSLSLVPAFVSGEGGPALLLGAVSLVATSVTLDLALLAVVGALVGAVAASLLAAPYGATWTERLGGVGAAIALAAVAEVGLGLLLRWLGASPGAAAASEHARGRVVRSARSLLEAGAGVAALAILPAALCAPWPGSGQAGLLLCWIALGPAAAALRSGALMRAGLTALLGAVAAIVATRLGPPLDPGAVLLGATAATLAGGLLGEVGGRRADLVAGARDATFLLGFSAAVLALLGPTVPGAFTAPLVLGVVGLRGASRAPSGQQAGLGAIAVLALSLAAARGALVLADAPWRLGAGSTTLACLAAAVVPVALRAALARQARSPGEALDHAPWVARLGCLAVAASALAAQDLHGAAAFAALAAVLLAAFADGALRGDAWGALVALAVAVVLADPGASQDASAAGRVAAILAALAALAVAFGALSGPRPETEDARWPVLRDVLGQAALVLGLGLLALLWLGSCGEVAERVWGRGRPRLDLLATVSLTLGAALLLASQAALVVRRDGQLALLAGWGAVVLLALRLVGHVAPEETWAATLPMAPALAGLVATLVVTSWPGVLRGPGEDGAARTDLLQTLGAGTAIGALAIAIPCDLGARVGGPGLAVSAGVALALAASWRREDLAHAGLGGLSLAAYTTTFRLLDVSPAHPERAIVGAAVALALCFALRTLALEAGRPRAEGAPAPRVAARALWTWAIVNSLAAFAAFGLFCALFYPTRHVAPAPWEVVLASVALLAGAAALHVELARRLRQGVFVYLAEVALAGTVLVVWVARPDLAQSAIMRGLWPIFVLVLAFALTGAGTLLERARLDVFSGPVQRSAMLLPLAPVMFGWVADERANAAALGLAAALYATTATLRGSTWPWIPAALLGNAALWKLLWIGQLPPLSRPELYMAPVGLTLAGVGRRLQGEHPKQAALLREGGAVLVLAALTVALLIDDTARLYEALGLAVASVAGVLLGIAYRIRPFIVLGAAFLAIDLTANAWWLSKEAAWVWWVWVVALGLGVIALFSSFERLRNALGPAPTDPS